MRIARASFGKVAVPCCRTANTNRVDFVWHGMAPRFALRDFEHALQKADADLDGGYRLQQKYGPLYLPYWVRLLVCSAHVLQPALSDTDTVQLRKYAANNEHSLRGTPSCPSACVLHVQALNTVVGQTNSRFLSGLCRGLVALAAYHRTGTASLRST